MSRVIKFSPLSNKTDGEPIEIKRLNTFSPVESFQDTEDITESVVCWKSEQKAQAIIARAEEQAAELLKRAEAEAAAKEKELGEKEATIDRQIEEARGQATSEGFEDGYQKGLAQAEEDYKTKLNEANKILFAAQSDYRNKIIESEPEILRLSVEIAGKILADKLESDENWTGFIQESLKQVKGEEDIKLFVSPKYYELTSTFTKELTVQLNAEIVVYPEVSIKDHTCLIETKYGRIDASVDSQLEEIKTKLLEFVGEEHGH
ncbi:flagellar assembly protein FliH [Alkalihalobacillus sp. TS-13]|uniref:flagellar assembly protein FliH n=1 Tax=Alkalihalobacillus sp. TS-13 TaxID=2842455 RepID=UPI001C86EED1|nr:flagellar assembly protein FliH [Alkalihalobacillus sp. TS-13]